MILLKLVDRNNLEAWHDPLHVEPEFTTDDIKRYLDSVFQQDRKYRFYIGGLLFDGSLVEEIVSRKLEVEGGVRIEYETDEDLIPDLALKLEDTLSFLKVTKAEGSYEIWCCTYGGALRMYRYADKLTLEMEFSKYHRVHGIVLGRRRYLYNEFGEVINFDTGEVVFRVVPDHITCLAHEEDIISAGTSAGRCLVFTDKLEVIHEFKVGISSTRIKNGVVEFTSLDGHIGTLCVSNNSFEKRRIEYNITSMSFGNNTRILGTSCSRLMIEKDDGESSLLKTNLRFVSELSMYSDNVVAQASQYVASIMNIQNSAEVRRVSVDDPISSIGWAGNMLFIGTGSSIHGYSMSSFLNNS